MFLRTAHQLQRMPFDKQVVIRWGNVNVRRPNRLAVDRVRDRETAPGSEYGGQLTWSVTDVKYDQDRSIEVGRKRCDDRSDGVHAAR
jgi:hypothetical protein